MTSSSAFFKASSTLKPASIVPSTLAAMRGITSERTLGSYSNLDDALTGLIGSIVAYLED